MAMEVFIKILWLIRVMKQNKKKPWRFQMEQQEESPKPAHENSAVLSYKETDNYN